MYHDMGSVQLLSFPVSGFLCAPPGELLQLAPIDALDMRGGGARAFGTGPEEQVHELKREHSSGPEEPSMGPGPHRRVVKIHQKPVASSQRNKTLRSSGSGRATTCSSRWTRDKLRLDELEGEAQEKRELADSIERENRGLRLRGVAMEHALAAVEKQMVILSSYNRLCCGPEASRMGPSSEARELQMAAVATIPSLAAKIQDFVTEASLLLLRISDCESRGQAADLSIMEKLTGMVMDMCNRTLCTAFQLNPKTQFEILLRRLDCPESGPSSPEPGHWDHVAAEVKLTQQQMEELGECWELESSLAMTKLRPELDAVLFEMIDALDRNSSLRIFELHRRLAAVESKETLAYRAFSYMMFGRIFTPVQLGRALVHSFPYFPNARELAIRLLKLHTT